MTVNLPLPQKADLKPVKGFEMGIAEAGIKKVNRKDLLAVSYTHLTLPTILRV